MAPCRLIPLLLLGSTLGGGAIAASLGHAPLAGALTGFLLGLSPLVLLGLAYACWNGWRPDRPRCRMGRCGADDYEFLERRETPLAGGPMQSYLYRCRCGDRYVQRGRRFVQIATDGTEQPFMAVSGWGRWSTDRS